MNTSAIDQLANELSRLSDEQWARATERWRAVQAGEGEDAAAPGGAADNAPSQDMDGSAA